MRARLTDRRIQIVVIVALGLIVVHNARYFTQRGKAKRQPVEMEAPIEEMTGETETPKWASGGYAVASEWGRDPFDPTGGTDRPATQSATERGEVTAKAPALPRIRITGIGAMGDNRFVLAGDKILREGDRVGPGTITKIGAKSVVVDYGGRTKIIKLD